MQTLPWNWQWRTRSCAANVRCKPLTPPMTCQTCYQAGLTTMSNYVKLRWAQRVTLMLTLPSPSGGCSDLGNYVVAPRWRLCARISLFWHAVLQQRASASVRAACAYAFAFHCAFVFCFCSFFHPGGFHADRFLRFTHSQSHARTRTQDQSNNNIARGSMPNKPQNVK